MKMEGGLSPYPYGVSPQPLPCPPGGARPPRRRLTAEGWHPGPMLWAPVPQGGCRGHPIPTTTTKKKGHFSSPSPLLSLPSRKPWFHPTVERKQMFSTATFFTNRNFLQSGQPWWINTRHFFPPLLWPFPSSLLPPPHSPRGIREPEVLNGGVGNAPARF